MNHFEILLYKFSILHKYSNFCTRLIDQYFGGTRQFYGGSSKKNKQLKN